MPAMIMSSYRMYHPRHFSIYTSTTIKRCYCKASPSPSPSPPPYGFHFPISHTRRISKIKCFAASYSSSSSLTSDNVCVHDSPHPSSAEKGGDFPSDRPSVAGGVVALGKFDALHIGHRELAIQAAEIGNPFLMSFVGMAEVLGWEPRAPIVAKCDRKRVLSSWAPFCGNVTPKEFEVQFSQVRSLSPQAFVEKLSEELGVRGVVAGQNYRFGYRAAGTSSDLVELCDKHGMKACIINCVMDKSQDPKEIGSTKSAEQGQVSSTRVRHALAIGDMKYVSEMLGRHHRLMVKIEDMENLYRDRKRISFPRSCLLNLAPKEGIYENCSLIIGDESLGACRLTIDLKEIHLELNELVPHIDIDITFQSLLGIDFGDSKL